MSKVNRSVSIQYSTYTESSNPTVWAGKCKVSGAGRLRCLRCHVIVSTSTCGANWVFEASPNGSGRAVCKYPGIQASPPRVGIGNNACVEEAACTCTGDFDDNTGGIVLLGERGDDGANEMTNPSDVLVRALGNPSGGSVSSGPLSSASNNGGHFPRFLV